MARLTARQRGEALYGKKPIIPKFPDAVDPAAEAAKAAKTIDPFLPAGEKITDAQIRDVGKMQESFMPGYGEDIQPHISNMIEKMVSGKTPLGDAGMFAQKLAERRVARGGGVGEASDMEINTSLRAFGLREMDMFKAGTDMLARQFEMSRQNLAMTPNYGSMMLTAGQAYAGAQQHQQDFYQQERDRATVSAMPDPVAVGQQKWSMTPEGRLHPELRTAQQEYNKWSTLGSATMASRAMDRVNELKRMSGLA